MSSVSAEGSCLKHNFDFQLHGVTYNNYLILGMTSLKSIYLIKILIKFLINLYIKQTELIPSCGFCYHFVDSSFNKGVSQEDPKQTKGTKTSYKKHVCNAGHVIRKQEVRNVITLWGCCPTYYFTLYRATCSSILGNTQLFVLCGKCWDRTFKP